MAQPFSIIDLVAILPFGALRALRTFRFLRLARLLRAFKLARYSSGLSGYVEELKKRSYELMMVMLVNPFWPVGCRSPTSAGTVRRGS